MTCGVPVCLFIYFMDINQGYYSWLREPAQDGALRLEDNKSSVFHLLNKGAVDAIVSQVQQWYKTEKRQVKVAPPLRFVSDTPVRV